MGTRGSTYHRLVRWWWRLAPAWRRAIVTALVLRAAVTVVVLAAGGLLPGLDPVPVAALPEAGFRGWGAATSRQQGLGLVGAGLERFDALWYLAIARDGYPVGTGGLPQAAAFYPGTALTFGLLGRVLGGAYLLAANLVSLAGTVVGLAGLHRLAEQLGLDDGTARRSLLTLAVFPSAFFLVAPYSEAAFLAASVWTLLAARQRRWGLAAVAGLAAGLTRNVGVLLALPVAIEAATAWRRRSGGLAGPVVSVVAAPTGAALYLAWGWVSWGVVAAPVQAQSGWERTFTWPWAALLDAFRFATGSLGRYPTGYHTLDLLVAVPVLVTLVWLVRRLPPSLWAYTGLHVAVWLTAPFPGRPLMSVPRFALAAVPVFLAFGAWTRRPAFETVWVAVSAALLGIHLLLFVGWYYVF